jgi:hypothetical protein
VNFSRRELIQTKTRLTAIPLNRFAQFSHQTIVYSMSYLMHFILLAYTENERELRYVCCTGGPRRLDIARADENVGGLPSGWLPTRSPM